ncbi:probable catabolite repression protein creC isoform X2 [Punica granatum]|nr:probable catabolite repression protein creC isoform X2 [Punica granatum]
MINTANGMMSTSSSSAAAAPGGNAPSPGLKTYFKSPEGRYKLHYEKGHPSGLMHYVQGKTVTQATVATIKDKPSPPTPPSQPSSSFSASSGVRSAAARLLGSGNGSRALSFVGGNGGSKSISGGSRLGPLGSNSSTSNLTSNFDGRGTYLIFNMGDGLFISDLNSQDKEPMKAIYFNNVYPVCHAFDSDAKDGHDLLIGLSTGDVYSVSLRQQLQDSGKKLVGAQHYNKDGSVNGSRCTCISWVPGGDGAFVVAHADGNIYVYEKSKEGAGDSSFPAIKDPTQFSVAHARYSKSNPIARWHICQGSINGIAFSTDGTYLATVGRDGYLRVFDYSKEQLICGGKSYYGALLCCAWSNDGKYVLAGGEDDLVQIWSMVDRKVVAWGEGHNSWVSGVAFDSFWSSPNSDDSGDSVLYRFGSVGQDTQLLLWDLEMDEIVVPLRRPPGGSPTLSTGSQSSHWDNVTPVGTLQPAPSMRDIPKISPVVAHRVHTEPLSGLIFTTESVLTVCREGHIKVWIRPHIAEAQGASNPETALSTSLKDKPLLSSKVSNSSGYKQ